MIDLTTYITFILACAAVVIVPGPRVTVIVANSLRHGAKAGLANIAGTQAGLIIMLGGLAAGLQTIVETMALVFDCIRLAWLSPSVLERLVLRCEPTVLSIFDLCGVAALPWAEQPEKVFD